MDEKYLKEFKKLQLISLVGRFSAVFYMVIVTVLFRGSFVLVSEFSNENLLYLAYGLTLASFILLLVLKRVRIFLLKTASTERFIQRYKIRSERDEIFTEHEQKVSNFYSTVTVLLLAVAEVPAVTGLVLTILGTMYKVSINYGVLIALMIISALITSWSVLPSKSEYKEYLEKNLKT